jgi:hypothetical protein
MAIEPKDFLLALLGFGAIAFLGYIIFIANSNNNSSSTNNNSTNNNTISTFSYPKYKNKEEIVWVDWKGRERRTVIHRVIE